LKASCAAAEQTKSIKGIAAHLETVDCGGQRDSGERYETISQVNRAAADAWTENPADVAERTNQVALEIVKSCSARRA
jgi:hypothetical protein